MCGHGEGTRRAQYMKTPKCWESVWNASWKAAPSSVDDIFFLFSRMSRKILVTVNIVLVLWHLLGKTMEENMVSWSKFQQEVKLGRHMCFCVWVCACASVLPTIDSRGIAGDFSGCGQVQDTTHQFGGEAEYSLIFLYVCAYTTMAWN